MANCYFDKKKEIPAGITILSRPISIRPRQFDFWATSYFFVFGNYFVSSADQNFSLRSSPEDVLLKKKKSQ